MPQIAEMAAQCLHAISFNNHPSQFANNRLEYNPLFKWPRILRGSFRPQLAPTAPD